MGGKHKASKAAKKKIGNAPVAQSGGSSGGGGGPSRVLLLRHGQSEANATRRDMPDPPLTELGRVQATAWKGAIGRFGAEAVLVSPLRRALETALLAYDRVDVPIEVCRHARELWWDEQANTPSTPEALEAVLRDLPRGDEVRHALRRSCTPFVPAPAPASTPAQVCGLEEALSHTATTPQSEHDSIEARHIQPDGSIDRVWGICIHPCPCMVDVHVHVLPCIFLTICLSSLLPFHLSRR